MFSDLKQFVPAEYCFQCQGCCVFDSTETPWRPFMAQEERLRSVFKNPEKGLDNTHVNPQGYINTVCEEGKGRCQVFDRQKFLCESYHVRPFECQIYPFMVVEKEGRPFLAAHLGCPYVHEHWRDEGFNEYVSYLIERMQKPAVKNFLFRNQGIVRPYEEDDQFDFLYEFDLDHADVSDNIFSQRDDLTKTFKDMRCRLSAYAFPGLAVWDQIFSLDFHQVEGMACVFASDFIGSFLYYPPMGRGDIKSAVRAAFDILDRMNMSPGISRIENVPEQSLDLFSEDYRCAYKTDEYVYRREDIAGLRGNAYKSKRSDYNHFVRYHAAEFLPYEEGMAEECLALFDRWDQHKAEDAQEARMMLDDARASHRVMFRHYRDLGFTARVVKVDGKIVAYTFGYPLTDTDFCVFAEIADQSFKGLPSFIFREFCRDEVMRPFERVNVMDCFGLPQLEVTKQSFRPVEVLPVYTIYKN